ncbi:MAG: hypothetical protein IID50_00670, partial [Proteobacteria bacterium]|nr:hypothetical protein [Pseudomonadota bacterium]
DLRPGAPGWSQAVDDHYASLADALETTDPDTRARFEDDYARATGVLPEPVAKRLRAGLLSADPAEQAAAATRLARLKDVDPALVSAIPANERRRAGAIAGFVDLGLPPPRAVELAEKKLAGGRRTEGADKGGDEDESPLVGPGGEGQTDEKPGKPGPPAVGNAGPPTNKRVDVPDMYNKLGFDPDGRGEINEFIQAPNTGTKGDNLFNDAEEKTAEQIRKGRFPKAGIGGGAADAFRHIYWSYRMTEDVGPDAAKRFGDAHEITEPTPDGDRLMDLYNNNLGRRLALDPANKGRPAEDVVLEAIKKGDAQTQPFKTRSTKTRVTPPPGIPLRRKSPSGF